MKTQLLTFAVWMILLPVTAQAEQYKTFGDYTVHYSAFTTDNMMPSIARSYKIPRSKNRVLVNIAIIKNQEGSFGEPVKSQIEGTATNLSQQLRELSMREIIEQGAIYYIADTAVNDKETLKFNFIITPDGESSSYTLSFQEQFYTE